MAESIVPAMGTRVSVQMFARDLLAHAGLVRVEKYSTSDIQSVVLADGAGVTVAISGDLSSLRLVVSAALERLNQEA
jgi:hypothetical protein